MTARVIGPEGAKGHAHLLVSRLLEETESRLDFIHKLVRRLAVLHTPVDGKVGACTATRSELHRDAADRCLPNCAFAVATATATAPPKTVRSH